MQKTVVLYMDGFKIKDKKSTEFNMVIEESDNAYLSNKNK